MKLVQLIHFAAAFIWPFLVLIGWDIYRPAKDKHQLEFRRTAAFFTGTACLIAMALLWAWLNPGAPGHE